MTAQPQTDRRHLRRAETIEELLSTAIEVMAEHGAGGLSLGEVARRMGIRPPSLYVYFDSKNAVYDAVFASGWQQVNDVMAALIPVTRDSDLDESLQRCAREFVGWCVAHPVHAQLMLWRPVPNWEPSATAYEPAVAALDITTRWLADLQAAGKLRADVAVEELVNAWTVLGTGVISRHLANDPHQPFEAGSSTQVLPALVSMYAAHYRATPPKKKRTS